MRRLIIGVLIGGLLAWLYRSELAGDRLRQKLAAAAAPMRERAETLASATASGARRVADANEATQLPTQVMDRATQVTTGIRSAAHKTHAGDKSTRGEQQAEQSLEPVMDNPVPEDVLAEQDAVARASADALREQQTGA